MRDLLFVGISHNVHDSLLIEECNRLHVPCGCNQQAKLHPEPSILNVYNEYLS